MSNEHKSTRTPRIPQWARVIGVGLASTVVIIIFQQYALLDSVRIDRVVERGFLALASDVIARAPDDGIRLIFIEAQDNGEELGSFVDDPQRWRAFHAELLRKLAEKGARVVAFDLVFPTTTRGNEAATDAFISAIQDVTNNTGTRVIIGYVDDEDPDRRFYAAIPKESWAETKIGAEVTLSRGSGLLQRILLATALVKVDQKAEAQTMRTPLSFPLALYAARNTSDHRSLRTFIDSDANALVLEASGMDFAPIQVDVVECFASQTGCDVSSGYVSRRHALLPLWMSASEFSDRPYHRVFEQAVLSDDYHDKVVIIGARTEDERVDVGEESRDGSAWGYAVHARVLADLQSGTYLRRPGLLTVGVWLAVLVAAGAAARRFLPGLEVPVSLGALGGYSLPLGLLIVVAVDALLAREALRFHELHPLTYHWLALLAGYYLVSGPPRSRLREEHS